MLKVPQETDCLWYSFPKAALFTTTTGIFLRKYACKILCFLEIMCFLENINYAFPEDFELISWSYSDSTMKNSLEKCVLIGFVTNEFFMKIYD